ncbi:LysR substrate-binding domain-containing protein [Acetobacter orientalis]|uniref:LysR family transcriptional regulator n=1 Tax=Acetobacter orientalis TaxID=146474 RepID=UPI0039E9705D
MEQSHVTLDRMQTFVRIAERGQLVAVARELGIGQSTVTRHLHELEETLGVSLFVRTTRSVMLTDEGRQYYTQCLHILRLVEQANEDVKKAKKVATGLVRISCTAAFGILHVEKIIFAFQDKYPDIQVEFNLTDERIDLVREGIDIAIRLGPLTDSAMKLRSLGLSHRVLVASPDWLQAHGVPQKPQDLIGLDGVKMSRVHGSSSLHLQTPDDDHITVPFRGRLIVDHGMAARQAFVAGRGFGPAHHWLVDDCIMSGELSVLLPAYRLSPVPLSMLISPERANIARVRICADFLAEKIASISGIVK